MPALFPPVRPLFKRSLLALAFAAALAGPAIAVPVFHLSADLLLMQANDLKARMRLNANQQTLWNQVTGKAQAILRGREKRRERLQLDMKQGLENAQADLRSLNRKIEDEADISAAEDKQLRELLLVMNDALDDDQRRLANQFLTEQLLRRDEPEGGSEGRGRGRSGGAPSGGPGGGHGGMGGGMGGGRGGPGA